MRFAAVSSTLTLILYTASVSAAPIQDTTLAIRDDADIFIAREYALDDDLIESREYTLGSPVLESREVDDEVLFEARTPAKGNGGAGRRAPNKQRGGRPAQNGGRQNGRQAKPNAGGRKANGGGRQNKPRPGGRQNNRSNNGGRQNKPNGGRHQNRPNAAGAQPGKKKSFFSKVASGLSRTGRWVNKHQGDIKQGVSGAAQVAGTAANAYVDMKAQQGKTSKLGSVMQVVNAVQQGPR